MDFSGAGADAESCGDIPIVHAVCKFGQHFKLASGQDRHVNWVQVYWVQVFGRSKLATGL